MEKEVAKSGSSSNSSGSSSASSSVNESKNKDKSRRIRRRRRLRRTSNITIDCLSNNNSNVEEKRTELMGTTLAEKISHTLSCQNVTRNIIQSTQGCCNITVDNTTTTTTPTTKPANNLNLIQNQNLNQETGSSQEARNVLIVAVPTADNNNNLGEEHQHATPISCPKEHDAAKATISSTTTIATTTSTTTRTYNQANQGRPIAAPQNQVVNPVRVLFRDQQLQVDPIRQETQQQQQRRRITQSVSASNIVVANRRLIERQIEAIQAADSRRWNFDFRNCRPLAQTGHRYLHTATSCSLTIGNNNNINNNSLRSADNYRRLNERNQNSLENIRFNMISDNNNDNNNQQTWLTDNQSVGDNISLQSSDKFDKQEENG